MRFLQAITVQGETKYFNMDKIITISDNGSHLKILCGAGLWWDVRPQPLRIIDDPRKLIEHLQGD